MTAWAFTLRAGNQASDRLAQVSITRAHTQTQQATRILLGPITAILGPLAEAETLIAAPELLQSERGAKVLLASLAGDNELHGVGIAFSDHGHYLIAQKVTPTMRPEGGTVPGGSREAIRQIDQAGNDAPIPSTYFGDEGQVIERRPLRTDHDPVSARGTWRPWRPGAPRSPSPSCSPIARIR